VVEKKEDPYPDKVDRSRLRRFGFQGPANEKVLGIKSGGGSGDTNAIPKRTIGADEKEKQREDKEVVADQRRTPGFSFPTGSRNKRERSSSGTKSDGVVYGWE